MSPACAGALSAAGACWSKDWGQRYLDSCAGDLAGPGAGRTADRAAGQGPYQRGAGRDAGHVAPRWIASHQPGRAARRGGPAAGGRHRVVEKGSRPAARPAVRPAQRRDRAGLRRGELKLYGSAMRAGPHLHGAMSDAWWSAWPPDRAIVFSLRIDHAVFIEWDIERALMTVHRWSQEAGYSQASRTYP